MLTRTRPRRSEKERRRSGARDERSDAARPARKGARCPERIRQRRFPCEQQKPVRARAKRGAEPGGGAPPVSGFPSRWNMRADIAFLADIATSACPHAKSVSAADTRRRGSYLHAKEIFHRLDRSVRAARRARASAARPLRIRFTAAGCCVARNQRRALSASQRRCFCPNRSGGRKLNEIRRV